MLWKGFRHFFKNASPYLLGNNEAVEKYGFYLRKPPLKFPVRGSGAIIDTHNTIKSSEKIIIRYIIKSTVS